MPGRRSLAGFCIQKLINNITILQFVQLHILKLHFPLSVKILTYATSIVLSVFLYTLFSDYILAGHGAALPLASIFCTLIIFGFLSWFHFFKPRLGAVLLTLFIIFRFLLWPLILFVDYFPGGYHVTFVEALIPPFLSVLVIIFVWRAEKQKDVNRYVKFVLAIPPLLVACYELWYLGSLLVWR